MIGEEESVEGGPPGTGGRPRSKFRGGHYLLRPGEVALGRHCGSSVARRSRRPSPVTNPGRHAANPHLHPPPARAAPSPTCERCWLPPTVEQPKEKNKKKQKKTKKQKKQKKHPQSYQNEARPLKQSPHFALERGSARRCQPGPASTICVAASQPTMKWHRGRVEDNVQLSRIHIAPSLPSASAVSGSVRTQVKRPLGTHVRKPPG